VWIWSVVAGVALSPDVPVGAQVATLVGPMMVAVSVVWHAVGSATDEAYAER
jgi:hypothetical protein